MAIKGNEGKGVEPEARALGYIITLPNGNEVFCSVLAYEKDPRGHYRAWVHHPSFGCEIMTPKEGRLDGAKAIIALTTEDEPALIERIQKAIGTVNLDPSIAASLALLRARLDEVEGDLATLRKAAKATASAVAPVDAPTPSKPAKKGKETTAPLGPSKDLTVLEAAHLPEAPQAEGRVEDVKDDLDFLDE